MPDARAILFKFIFKLYEKGEKYIIRSDLCLLTGLSGFTAQQGKRYFAHP